MEEPKAPKEQEQQENIQASDFEFLQEKIKERPIDKKKLIQRTIITASLALLFGLIACLTFLVLEPVLNNWIYPEEEPEIVTFPQEEDEMLPEDMLTENTGDQAQTDIDERYEIEDFGVEETIVENETESVSSKIEEYELLHDELYDLYQQISTSMVTVTSVKSEVDWFNNTYESEGQNAGVIIANNSRELLIMTKNSFLDTAERIMITFCNGVSVEGIRKGYDENTDLAVVAVDLKHIKGTALDAVSVASLGSSMGNSLVSSPVIAIGNIQGYKENMCFGMVTSTSNIVSLPDSQYKMITTDIYGSQSPSGILVNMKGQVVGVIDNAYNHTDTKNMVSAIGISELKGLITKISNGNVPAYVGLYVQDISTQVRKEQNLPQGAYISDIDMDSPAMLKGIQKGDIISQVNDKEINTASDYMNAIRSCEVGDEITITVLRASKDDYEQMKFVVTTQDNQ